VLDAQVGTVDVVLGQAGEPGEGGHGLRPLRGGEPVAAGEHPRVVARGIHLGLREHAAQAPPAVLAVVVRHRGVGRQEVGVATVLRLVQADRPEVEHAGDQHDAVEVHAVAGLQVLGQRGGPQGAVGLAGEELG